MGVGNCEREDKVEDSVLPVGYSPCLIQKNWVHDLFVIVADYVYEKELVIKHFCVLEGDIILLSNNRIFGLVLCWRSLPQGTIGCHEHNGIVRLFHCEYINLLDI